MFLENFHHIDLEYNTEKHYLHLYYQPGLDSIPIRLHKDVLSLVINV